jgi:hypothetical protein
MTDQKPDDPRAREEDRWTNRATSFVTQANEAAFKASENTFRGCLLINGGAAVSVLAFIGSLASKPAFDVSQLAAVADSLTAFAGGAVLAVFGMAFSYFVNYSSAENTNSLIERRERTVWFGRLKPVLHVLTIFVGAGSLACFICGIFAVRYSIENIQPATHAQASCAKPSP